MTKSILVVGLAAVALAACSNQTETGGDPAAELRATDQQLSRAVAAKDAARIANFYAADAVLMPTAEPIVTGKEAIRKEWEHVVAIPAFETSGKLEAVEVSASGDLGFTRGSYNAKMMGEDGRITNEPGKWITVWKRLPGGQWLIVADTYNTDIPPPDHK